MKIMLYQVHVTQGKTEIPVGPAVPHQRVLEPLAEAINVAVINGTEKRWHDARIVRVTLH